jgi:acetylornithine/N-succinyldiaminopimelate aminotransferase
VVKAALGERLLVAGASDNVVRLLPPLNIADEEIAEAIERLSRALERVAAPAT